MPICRAIGQFIVQYLAGYFSGAKITKLFVIFEIFAMSPLVFQKHCQLIEQVGNKDAVSLEVIKLFRMQNKSTRAKLFCGTFCVYPPIFHVFPFSSFLAL